MRSNRDAIADEIEAEIRARGNMTLPEIQEATGSPGAMAGVCALLMQGRIRESWEDHRGGRLPYVVVEEEER